MQFTLFVLAVCLCFASAEAVGVDSHGDTFAVDINPKFISLHRSQSAQASSHQRVARREEQTKSDVKMHPAQLQLSQDQDSQDGAVPYFVGNWNGYRNNWYGDVGISFVPQRDFTIVSLGRHIHNESGLLQTLSVTLWSVETKMPLAIVNVGPNSGTVEGHYRWAPVDEPGVAVSQGREYRLTQACTPGMADKWYDRIASEEEVEANAAMGTARFVGGVNQSGFGYPVNANGQFRRPGMVNFKIKSTAVPAPENQNRARHHAEVWAGILAVTAWSVLTGIAKSS